MEFLVRAAGWAFVGLAVYGLICLLAQLYMMFIYY